MSLSANFHVISLFPVRLEDDMIIDPAIDMSQHLFFYFVV